MVSNNIYNPKYNVPMQALGQSQPGGIPMQAIDGQVVKQTVDNSYISNRVKASTGEDENPLATLGLTAALWYAIMRGMEGFTQKCSGAVGESNLDKMAAWGDKVQNKFMGTSLGGAVKKGHNGISKLWGKLTQKSKIAYSLANHSTRAEWNMARVTGEGLTGFFGMDVNGLFTDFMKPMSKAQALEQYGYTQAQIDTFANSIKGLSKSDKALAFAKEELKALGADAKTIEAASRHGLKGYNAAARRLKTQWLGFDSVKQFKKCSANVIDNLENIYKAFGNANPKLSISIWRGDGKLGKTQAHLFGRKVPISEMRNKLGACLGKLGNTKLGNIIPKASGYFIEGTTNRFAGGKIGILMQAAIFADMLIHTFKAPKGEKWKTFTERFTNDFAYFMAAPIAYAAMHKVGGLKYAGLDKAGVENYRAALKAFNAKAKAGGFATKAEYKAAKKALKQMLRADVKNPITRIFKGIGRIINVGNETRAAYVSKSALNMNLLRKIPNFLKNCVGVPMRFLIPMALITPVIAKAFTKVSHAIFGRPTHSVLDEDQEPTPEQQPQVAQYPQQPYANNPFAGPIEHTSPTNLLNMHLNGQTYRNTTTNTTVNNTIVNSEPEADGKVLEPVRTYIPSPEGVRVMGEDPTAAEQAIARSQAAEQRAMDILAMKW